MKANLRKTLEEKISLIELKKISFDLDVDYEDFAGDGKSNWIISLLNFLDHRNELAQILIWLAEHRPDIKIGEQALHYEDRLPNSICPSNREGEMPTQTTDRNTGVALNVNNSNVKIGGSITTNSTQSKKPADNIN